MTQQHELGLAGVLELVEQNCPKPLTFHRTDIGEPLGQGGSQCHLVREVERIPAPLEPDIGLHQWQHLAAGTQRCHRICHQLGHGSCPAGPLGQPGHPGLEVVDQPMKVARHQQVLGHLSGQVDHGSDDR